MPPEQSLRSNFCNYSERSKCKTCVLFQTKIGGERKCVEEPSAEKAEDDQIKTANSPAASPFEPNRTSARRAHDRGRGGTTFAVDTVHHRVGTRTSARHSAQWDVQQRTFLGQVTISVCPRLEITFAFLGSESNDQLIETSPSNMGEDCLSVDMNAINQQMWS